jgi:hypothetical protein
MFHVIDIDNQERLTSELGEPLEFTNGREAHVSAHGLLMAHISHCQFALLSIGYGLITLKFTLIISLTSQQKTAQRLRLLKATNAALLIGKPA